jgi:Bacterial PH domain
VFSRQGLLSERQVYRTTGSLVAWWAWAAFAAVLLIVLALSHRDHTALVTAIVIIAITGIMYACALRPRIVASAADITVVNPLREHVLPWSAVTQVDLVHNVRVHYRGPAGDRIAHSWAVQSSGRSRTRSELRARSASRGRTPAPGYTKLPGEAQAALAGSAAEFIARQLDEQARMHRTAAAPDTAPARLQVRWTWVPIAAMAVPLLILLVVTLA